MATQTQSKKPNDTEKPEPDRAPIPLIEEMARQYGVDGRRLYETLASTVFASRKDPDTRQPVRPTAEEIIAFLTVARQHNLNPWAQEITAFPKKGGGIQIVVPIDGWLTILNRQPEYDGIEFIDQCDESGDLVAVTAIIYRRDRSHPTQCTEYMTECRMPNKEPWTKWPRRMLRHKATIQCARLAFGLTGIVDTDEADRMRGIGLDASHSPIAALPGPRQRATAADFTQPTLANVPEPVRAKPDPAPTIDGSATTLRQNIEAATTREELRDLFALATDAQQSRRISEADWQELTALIDDRDKQIAEFLFEGKD